MKRILTVLTLVFLLTVSGICLPARADSAASSVDLQCSVTAEGDCLVTMTVMLRLETAHSSLTFPLPANARNITMNGSSVFTSRSASATDVDISRIVRDYVGESSIRFEYTIPDAVQVDMDAFSLTGNRQLKLEIPLLCGFEYPVEILSFTITMPSSELKDSPDFTSIYRQGSMASDLNVVVNGNQIIGASKTTLNDHDGVTMTMIVPQSMFPSVSTYIRVGNPELIWIIGLGAAALVYWLLFLSSLPLRASRSNTPPAGVTAGEVGCRLTQSGADLTMMVFSWAQLGYILIQLDSGGRVLLHKRMDMGNERDAFENKVFKWLFSARSMVDATGYPYAKLVRRVAEMVPNEKAMYKTSSGNSKIFRLLACASHAFCGVCVAMNMSTVTILQVLMALILGAFGAVTGWLLQRVAYCTHLRGKMPVYIGFPCLLIWVVLGLLCGQVWIPLCSCLVQWAFGYLAAYGGRRSDLGRHDAGIILGLRRYLKKLPRDQVNRLLREDPDYFFNMAPYALSLGVMRPFSVVFGRRMLEQCPYIMTRSQGKRTAEEWGHLMTDVANMMDSKSHQLQVEKLLSIRLRPLPQTKTRQR